MKTFTFERARGVEGAVEAGSGDAAFIAGGTTLVDLMKLDVMQPSCVVDINALPISGIEQTAAGLRIGALARNADVARHPAVEREYPVLAQALLSGASAQLRNMASTGGNLLQRTRCVYFRDTASACNKRAPGSGCAAIGGFNRNLAILGTSDRCIATNPSDQNVALTALEATVEFTGPRGSRSVPIDEFYRLPGDAPERETVLEPGDLVTSVTLPARPGGERSLYLKLRDRASYEFALASAAVAVTLRDGTIERARIAMGGIATKPWRCREAEALLQGAPATAERFGEAAALVLRDARPQSQNGFKIELARRCLVHALTLATASEAR